MQCTMEVTKDYAARLAAAFTAEGQGYYALPGGVQWGPVEAPKAWYALTGEAGDEVRRGVHLTTTCDGKPVTTWVRSSGTWVAVLQDGPYNLVLCHGSRHSIREVLAWGFEGLPMREALAALPAEIIDWTYHNTQRSDLAPWETAT